MSYTLETLPVGLTGSFGADRLRDMLAAAQKGAVGELPVVSEAWMNTLVGFPAVGSQEHGRGIFWSRLLVGGVYEPVLWVRPTKACFVGGAACDWVGFPIVLETGNYQAFELGYLYQGSVLKQEASPLALTPAQLEAALVIAIAGSNPKDTLDDVLNPWSVNPANVKAILSYVAPLTSNIQWDAQGNADFLHNVQVMGGLTVDGALNANDSDLGDAAASSLTTTGAVTVGGILTVNQYELDSAIGFTSGGGVSFPYAHARVSNGKLNIVVFPLISSASSISLTQNVDLTIPASVGNALYPSIANMLAAIVYTSVEGYGSDASVQPSISGVVRLRVFKNSATSLKIQINVALPTASATISYIPRFEFNFTLS